MAHLRRVGDELSGCSSRLWPDYTDFYTELEREPEPPTIATTARLHEQAAELLRHEKYVTITDLSATPGRSPELAKRWEQLAALWDRLTRDALTAGMPSVAAAAAQRAFRAFLLSTVRHDSSPAGVPFRPAGAEGRRVAALLDPDRRPSYPLWIPAWVAETLNPQPVLDKHPEAPTAHR
jgi:hypothetical protein